MYVHQAAELPPENFLQSERAPILLARSLKSIRNYFPLLSLSPEYCSDTDFGESLYPLINVFVLIYLAGKSTAPLLGGGLIVRLVERVKGCT